MSGCSIIWTYPLYFAKMKPGLAYLYGYIKEYVVGLLLSIAFVLALSRSMGCARKYAFLCRGVIFHIAIDMILGFILFVCVVFVKSKVGGITKENVATYQVCIARARTNFRPVTTKLVVEHSDSSIAH